MKKINTIMCILGGLFLFVNRGFASELNLSTLDDRGLIAYAQTISSPMGDAVVGDKTLFELSLETEKYEAAQFFLAQGLNLESTASKFKFPLIHYALDKGLLWLLDALYTHKADFNSEIVHEDGYKGTLLHFAIQGTTTFYHEGTLITTRPQLVEKFITYGANPNARDSEGNSCFDGLFMHEWDRYPDQQANTILYCIAHGADFSSPKASSFFEEQKGNQEFQAKLERAIQYAHSRALLQQKNQKRVEDLENQLKHFRIQSAAAPQTNSSAYDYDVYGAGW